LIIPSFEAIVLQIRQGFYIFISIISSSLYTNSNAFILGLLTNNSVVAYYSAGEKIVKAVQNLFAPVSQAMFPHVSYLAYFSKKIALKFIRKVVILSSFITFFISIFLFLFASDLVFFLFGSKYVFSVGVVKILAFLPFICSLGNIFGTQIMMNFRMEKYFSRVIIVGGLFNILIAVLLIPEYGQYGMAFSVTSTEFFISFLLFIILESKKISPRNKWILSS